MGKITQVHPVEVGEAMQHAATKLSDDLNRTARDAQEAAEELGEALRHSATEMAAKAKSRASEARQDVRRSVREHPIAWLGAAAGAGALVTLLVAAGRSR